jgi:hypothetical protein
MGSWHGDAARAIFYMTLRYTGLTVVNGAPANSSGNRQIGDLATLIQWHRADPPDDFEMNRNNVIYTWQVNRNPFIDRPELVEFIWGNQVGQPFTLSTSTITAPQITLYPNPNKGSFTIQGMEEPTTVTITDVFGKTLTQQQTTVTELQVNQSFASGMYFVSVQNSTHAVVKKIIVE